MSIGEQERLEMEVPRSVSLAPACEAMLSELRGWIGECIDHYGDADATNGHDQGTFVTSWTPHVRRGGDRAIAFAKTMRDRIRNRFRTCDWWYHGYWRMQEAHHGTEHFELFLGELWRWDPRDKETIRQIDDAAEHLGNFSPDVPPWLNPQTSLYRSVFFGTDGVKHKPGSDVNVPDHFRCMNIALLAADATGNGRYEVLARNCARRWAKAILSVDAIPAGLASTGPVFALHGEGKQKHRGFFGQTPELVDDVNRAENLLASGAVGTLLELWRRGGGEEMLQAAQRICDVLATQLGDPDAGCAADAIRTWRRIAPRPGRYDTRVIDAVRNADPFGFDCLAVAPCVQRDSRPQGVGKRQDMPEWFEDDRPRGTNPITLSLAAEITGDAHLAVRAVDLARAHFALARQAYPDGRDHGCSARTVNAVARGHGRENGSGMVTAVLTPMLELAGL
jgi:hypothetical protein